MDNEHSTNTLEQLETPYDRAMNLLDEINGKLSKSIGLCDIVMDAREVEREAIATTMWTASDLLREAKEEVEAAHQCVAQAKTDAERVAGMKS